MTRKVLVTGASGFIAGHVIDELVESGDEPIRFDRHGKGPANVFLGDIRDASAVHDAVAVSDAVIHLAGVLGTQETIQNPRPAFETNVSGMLNVLEAAARYEIPVVNIGVGNHWMNNSYSISKSTAERLCAMYREYRDVTVSTVRVVNAYGPRQVAAVPFGPSKVRKVAPAFICRALSGQPIEIYGDGSQTSDMVYVRDVARCLVAAVGSSADVEVGPSVSTTVNEFAGLVADAAGHLTGERVELRHLPMRPGEIPGAVVTADTATLARIAIDPTLFLPLSAGVESTVGWFSENEGLTWQRP